MSIFDIEVPEQSAPKNTPKPWNIRVMLQLYLSSNLTPKAVPATLTALHLQGHTGITEAVLNKMRQLFTRLGQPAPADIHHKLQDLMKIIGTAIEEGRDIDKDLALKVNMLLGPNYKISHSALKTLEFVTRLGYCVNEDLAGRDYGWEETAMEGGVI